MGLNLLRPDNDNDASRRLETQHISELRTLIEKADEVLRDRNKLHAQLNGAEAKVAERLEQEIGALDGLEKLRTKASDFLDTVVGSGANVSLEPALGSLRQSLYAALWAYSNLRSRQSA